jgi:hypothetical protein
MISGPVKTSPSTPESAFHFRDVLRQAHRLTCFHPSRRMDHGRASAGILDQVLAAADRHPKKTLSGWAPDRVWDPDLLEDSASWPLG